MAAIQELGSDGDHVGYSSRGNHPTIGAQESSNFRSPAVFDITGGGLFQDKKDPSTAKKQGFGRRHHENDSSFKPTRLAPYRLTREQNLEYDKSHSGYSSVHHGALKKSTSFVSKARDSPPKIQEWARQALASEVGNSENVKQNGGEPDEVHDACGSTLSPSRGAREQALASLQPQNNGQPFDSIICIGG